MSSKRGRGMSYSKVGLDYESELKSQLEEREENISKKENIKFFETDILKNQAYIIKKELHPDETCDQYIKACIFVDEDAKDIRKETYKKSKSKHS